MVPPRTRPYPYDVILAGSGLMLGRVRKGAGLIATKPADQDRVSPTDYGYSAQNPVLGRWQSYEDMSGGMGLKVQQGFTDKQYYEALGADLSLGLPWIKGPAVSSYTPGTRDSTNGITHFFELGSDLFALNGRYVLKRASDSSWTAVDLGASTVAQDVAAFYSPASSELAYIACGDTVKFFSFDGTTATQHGTLYARAFAKVGREFYRAHDTNMLAKCDTNADPLTAGNWGAANAFRVGDKAAGINRLAVTASGALVIYKSDGIYSLNPDGTDSNLYPFLGWTPDDLGGLGNAAWLNDLYVGYNQACYRIRADWAIEQVAEPPNYDGVVQGRYTAFAGHQNFVLYAAVWNADDGGAYIRKLTRGSVWHGSIIAKSTTRITALGISEVGAPTGHQRLYLGYSDGTLGWFTLPCAANPLSCTEYEYTTGDATVYLPRATFLFPSDAKAVRKATVAGEGLATGVRYAQLEFKTTPDAADYTALGHDFDSERETWEFPANTSGTTFDLKVILKSTTDAASPELMGVGINHSVRTETRLLYTFLVLADEGIVRRDGVPLRYTASKIRSLVKAAAETAGSVALTLPDEATKDVSIVGYGESVAWDERLRRWRAALEVQAIEFKTLTVLGTVCRLNAFTVCQLESYTVCQMEAL